MAEITDKKLIGEIKKLSQIKPTKEWVSMTKSQILGQEADYQDSISIIRLLFSFKPAFAAISVFLLIGAFGFAQNALPGDLLYSVKRITEKSQAAFVSTDEKPAFQLKLANEKLEGLAKAPARNLAPTINEFQANISEATKNLSKIDASSSDPVAIKRIVEETKKLKENKEKVEALGVVIGGDETAGFNDALKSVAENLIADLQERSLTAEKENVFNQMKELFTQGKYTEVLEAYLSNQ